MLVFSMNTFEDIMDYVQDNLVGNDIRSEKYREQIGRNKYHRWFAYDVTMNHLRHYMVLRRHGVALTPEYLNNKDGPRWALYPDVMELVDEYDDVRVVADKDVDEYVFPPEMDRIGVVCTKSVPISDRRIEYVNTIDIYSNNIRLETFLRRLPNLIHLHCEDSLWSLREPTMHNHSITITNLTIKYLSVINIGLEFHRGLRVDYLRYMAYNDHNTRLNIRELEHDDIYYLDRHSTLAISRYVVGQVWWPRLEHMGGLLRVDGILAQSQYAQMFPMLTSACIYSNGSNVKAAQRMPDLVCLEIHQFTQMEQDALPTSLKNVRVLHIVHTLPYSSMNYRIGRWNLPKVCRILSFRHGSYVGGFECNFDLSKFVKLRHLMILYDDHYMSWIESQKVPESLMVGYNGAILSDLVLQRGLKLPANHYLNAYTRTDRSYTLSKFSTFLENPLLSHYPHIFDRLKLAYYNQVRAIILTRPDRLSDVDRYI